MTSFIGKIRALFNKQDNKQKKISLSTLLSALHHDDDMLIYCEMDGIILFCNDAAKGYFSHLKEGVSVFTILRSPIIREIFDEFQETQKAKLSCDIKLRIPNEKFIKVHAMHSASSILLRLQDVTEQKNTLRMHGDFVANVSHELRTPLASICGFIETLQGPAKGDEAATEQFLGIMSAQAKRMNHLIQSLLSLSRIEMDQHILPTSISNLTAILDDVVNAMIPLLNARNMSIEIDFDPAKERPIRAVSEQIFQVFQNLIENAMKYSADETQITLAIEDKQDGYIVHVKDQGYGIAHDHLPRLTERFYRVDDARHRSEGGAGLGLSIVAKIIKRHQGQLNVISELSKGSDFTVFLPAILSD